MGRQLGDLAGRALAAAAVTLWAPAVVLAAPCAESLPAVFARVSPAVVSLQATRIHKGKPHRRFETSLGAGVIIDRDGHVVTNAHVVGGAASLSATLAGGERITARVLGLDPALDLALVRLEARPDLATARLGDSGTLRVGDDVVTIGSPVGLEQSMTRGIVSGLNRVLPGVSEHPMIQTDAPINPGNSGGPLVDRCGEVVGITTLVSEDAHGVGFAIPINAARTALGDLRAHGRVIRAWLGIVGRAVEPRLMSLLRLPLQPGYLVEIVYDDSPAERAGVRGGSLSLVIQGEEFLVGGDIVTALDGLPLRTHEDYVARVRGLKPGQRIRLTLVREGKVREVTVTVGERPRLPSDLGD